MRAPPSVPMASTRYRMRSSGEITIPFGRWMSGAARMEDEEPQTRRDRDAVTLRIVEVDLSTLETLQAPTYRGVQLQQWTGENHVTVFGQVRALAEAWHPRHIVVDATGGRRPRPADQAAFRQSGIYCAPEQERVATESKARTQANFKNPIVTEIVPATTFYRAEEYHQQYLQKRGMASCHLR